MKTIMKVLLLGAVLTLISGCARNFYNVPRETFEKKVRVLGVAPIMLDAESDIRYPEKEALVSLLKEFNRKNNRELVAQCKASNIFFLVQPLADDPDQLFSTLYFRREKRDDAGIIYNKHFFKGPELRELITKNKMDALMVVVMSGLTKHGRRYSSNLIHYLESDYNNIILTAQILDADGTILWEYPNFRQRSPSFPSFLALQYPDFDEAAANESEKVQVRFKTIDGIRRALEKKEKSSVLSNVEVSSQYAAAFEEMMSLLKPETSLFGGSEKRPASDAKQEAKPVEEEKKPVKSGN